jgi:hypothetical protein
MEGVWVEISWVEVFVEGVEGYVLDWCHGKKAELRTDEVV